MVMTSTILQNRVFVLGVVCVVGVVGIMWRKVYVDDYNKRLAEKHQYEIDNYKETEMIGKKFYMGHYVGW